MSSFTCINCNVKFANADIQREHYKTDWHRYNLKRRVADFPPVTAEEFQKRVLQQKQTLESPKEDSSYCLACHKQFSTKNAYDNHLNSKKHKENEINSSKIEKPKSMNDETQPSHNDNPKDNKRNSDEDIDMEEWEEVIDNPIANSKCLFCEYQSDSIENLVQHLSVEHSFFIPDIEFCIDLEGLLFYLAEKVVKDFICLWCNDRGRTFYSLDAVRKHMIDKGHCKMLHEGAALAEYIDFYDYSSSYPDAEGDDIDIDEEFEPDLLEGDEYQLVLPSGLVIGHRSLLRYYKQRLNPNRALTIHKSNKKLHKVLSQYRSLGWTTTQQEMAARKARDIHMMKRVQSKWSMQLGEKANKLQRHFRQQINF